MPGCCHRCPPIGVAGPPAPQDQKHLRAHPWAQDEEALQAGRAQAERTGQSGQDAPTPSAEASEAVRLTPPPQDRPSVQHQQRASTASGSLATWACSRSSFGSTEDPAVSLTVPALARQRPAPHRGRRWPTAKASGGNRKLRRKQEAPRQEDVPSAGCPILDSLARPSPSYSRRPSLRVTVAMVRVSAPKASRYGPSAQAARASTFARQRS